jgi:osmotically-inducible protein OsmY
MSTGTVEVIKFRFNTTVYATDGEAGTVDHVVINPGTREVTHVGVKIQRGFGGPINNVPLDRIVDARSHEVHLAVTREALLQTMPAVSPKDTILARATQVKLGSGGTGALMQVAVNGDGRKIRTLGVRAGNGEVLVNAQQLQGIDNNGRTLTVVASSTPFPEYRDDVDLFEEARARLFNYPRLRIDLPAIHMRVVDGELWLSGYVSSTLNRRIIEDLLVGIKGLYTVHDTIVADTDLAVGVARALANDPRTRGKPIGVYPILGTIYLRGLTPDPSIAEAATLIAAKAAGNSQIINQLAIHESAALIPMLAPVTGKEDIVPGGD